MFVLHGVCICDLSMYFATFLSTSSFRSKEHELDNEFTIDGVKDMALVGLEDIQLLTDLSITAIKISEQIKMHIIQLKKTTIFKTC